VSQIGNLFRNPVVWGIIATVTVVLASGFAFADNMEGFRKADSLAALLSACFSGIATVWLIVTVVRQGDELKLQREELRLQREETSRLADEAHSQSSSLETSAKFQARAALQQFIQRAIDIDEGSMHNIYSRLKEVAFELSAPEKLSDLMIGAGGSCNFTKNFAICSISQDGFVENLETNFAWGQILSGFESTELLYYWADFWDLLCLAATAAVKDGLGDFWRDSLAQSISPKSIDRNNEVKAVLLAALYTIEPSLAVSSN
jgi:hypothetical protein